VNVRADGRPVGLQGFAQDVLPHALSFPGELPDSQAQSSAGDDIGGAPSPTLSRISAHFANWYNQSAVHESVRNASKEKHSLTTDPSNVPGLRACPQCGTQFVCGSEAGLERCWCADLPNIMPVVADGPGCLCPDCLRAAIDERLQAAQQEHE
jgi:hypothetical protein